MVSATARLLSNSPAPSSALWDAISQAQRPPSALNGCTADFSLAALATQSILGGQLEALRGRCVVLAMREQLSTAIALVELDGTARRMVLCTPDVTAEQLAGVVAAAAADVLLIDEHSPHRTVAGVETIAVTAPQPLAATSRRQSETTEWILLTSGTSGAPKLVVHSLQTLAGALPRPPATDRPMVWSTFYDIRRYGGLQIYLRALFSGSRMILSSAAEATHDFLTRLGRAGVTHISGTPSHWRRALMSGDTALIAPEYVRLSGEVADQTVLDNLQRAFPQARVAHAFASTEAGVAFDINDGRAGFPARLLEDPASAIELKVQDGTLWIRSGRTAARYLGEASAPLTDAQGFVDTGDLVELDADRYHFRGRRGGIINVGGLKVYPEEVESVINADARVRMSLVKARRSPITGALIVAEVVPADPGLSNDPAACETLKTDLLEACRHALAAHKVPALLRFVPTLELTPAGKLIRPGGSAGTPTGTPSGTPSGTPTGTPSGTPVTP